MNRLFQKRLGAWMRSNGTSNWPVGCPFVQWGINTSYHTGVKATPYELRYGQLPTCGLSMLPLSDRMKRDLREEAELLEALPQNMRDLLTNEEVFVPGGEFLDDDPRRSNANSVTSSVTDSAAGTTDSMATASTAGDAGTTDSMATASTAGDASTADSMATASTAGTYDSTTDSMATASTAGDASTANSMATASTAGTYDSTADSWLSRDVTEEVWGFKSTYDSHSAASAPEEHEEHVWLNALAEEQTELPNIRNDQLHCAQVLAHSRCNMSGTGINKDRSGLQHKCKGDCGNYLHGICGNEYGDGNEMHRICFGCRAPALPPRTSRTVSARRAADAAAHRAQGRTNARHALHVSEDRRRRVSPGGRPPVTVWSQLQPDANVSPSRAATRAAAARALQQQGERMIAMATHESGGHLTLPIGLVVRHSKSPHDRAKVDTPTMLAVVVAKPGATVYTIATSKGYLDKNISKSYLRVPDPPLDPKLVGLAGVVEKYRANDLPKLTVREFARTDSLVGGPGIRRCGCKKGNCNNCTCSKAGAKCHSGCACAKERNCCNK